jgi:hypothetical protein
MFIFAPLFCNLYVKIALPVLRYAVVAMILVRLNFVVIKVHFRSIHRVAGNGSKCAIFRPIY